MGSSSVSGNSSFSISSGSGSGNSSVSLSSSNSCNDDSNASITSGGSGGGSSSINDNSSIRISDSSGGRGNSSSSGRSSGNSSCSDGSSSSRSSDNSCIGSSNSGRSSDNSSSSKGTRLEEKGVLPDDRIPNSEPLWDLLVGYALTSKKTKSFLQPRLVALARNSGISFVGIDQNRALKEQGPFHVILHKIPGMKWQRELEVYMQNHPDVAVIDPPDSINHLNNREFMLRDVADLNLCSSKGKVGVPKQLAVYEYDDNDKDKALSLIAESVAKAGLKLPLVAKPLMVDGTPQSHALSLAFTHQSLSQLHPPLVLQEFISHGGILFKVYIIGDCIKVMRRFSLPDFHRVDFNNGVMPFPRVSCAAASADGVDLDPQVGELPPDELLESLAKGLRQRLGLRLFNVDIIREIRNPNSYCVIDINYFPGFGKMPGYELMFINFLLQFGEDKDVGKRILP